MPARRTPSEIPPLLKEKHVIWAAAMDATQRIYEGKRSGWFSRRRAKAATAEVWEVSRQVDEGTLEMPAAALELLNIERRLKIVSVPKPLPARKPRNA